MGKRVVELHLCSSLEDLNKKVVIPNLTNKKTFAMIQSELAKLNKLAQNKFENGDEELEYIFLCKFIKYATAIPKLHPNFNKKNYPHYFEESKKYLDRLVILENNLMRRYKDVISSRVPNDQSLISLPKRVTPIETEKDNFMNKPFKSMDLHILLNQNQLKYLIIDVRSSQDFKSSSFKCNYVVNVPEEILKPSVTSNKIYPLLSTEYKILWDTRTEVDRLIVCDWYSTTSNQTPSMISILDCLIKWDQKTYKCKPLILEGGFNDFLDTYPNEVTNPKVQPPSMTSIDVSLNLTELAYPSLEPEKQTIISSFLNNSGLMTGNDPIIDDFIHDNNLSVIQPTKTYIAKKTEGSNGHPIVKVPKKAPPVIQDKLETWRKHKPGSKGDITKQNRTPENEPEKKLSITPPSSGFFFGKPEEGKRFFDTPKQPRKEVNKSSDGGDTCTVPLKKYDGGSNLHRTNSSPNISKDFDDDDTPTKPSFSREQKPLQLSERTTATYGTTGEGLTGLKNFSNNCYMNSIVQCLNNTEVLVKELSSITKRYAFNSKSRTKGKIAMQLISAFSQMWSREIKTYSIQELKTEMGYLYDIFQGAGHQDSHEFLILLLEHLHEDLKEAEQPVILSGASVDSGEKAWGEFKKKNSSIIQQLFYGQHKSTVTCSDCGHESVTFEQFLNIFVPLPSNDSKVALEHCLKLYMAGEKVSGWTCPECKSSREAYKKFYISKLPPILVIAIKRFSQHDSSSWLHKKENLVTYRLRGLDMNEYIVPNSEQRYSKYDLYAMSIHSGTMKSGHYRAICKNYLNEKWYMFDDQHVHQLQEESVRDNSEVYILFYSAVRDI